MARYVCTVCVYEYDETTQGVSWDALDADWVCPKCGASRAVFEPGSTDLNGTP